MRFAPTKVRSGFTLVELLVVLAIVSILVALLLPAIQSMRESARATVCRNKTRQIILGLLSFESANGSIKGANRHSFLVDILPYLDQGNLYNELDLTLSPGNPINTQVRKMYPISNFSCPSQQGLPFSQGNSYLGSAGTAWLFSGRNGSPDLEADRNGLFGLNEFSKVTDGLSNTIAVSESGAGQPSSFLRSVPARSGELDVERMDQLLFSVPITTNNFVVGWDWAFPGLSDSLYNHYLPPNQRSGKTIDNRGVYSSSSYHPGGVNMARADGSVSFIADRVDRNVWLQLGSAIDNNIRFKGF